MKLGLCGPHRRRFWIPVRVLLLGVALCWGMQAHARNCGDIYASIRSAAMYCGFFCDQDTLRPLQAAYEADCIVQVIPASLLLFESNPDVSSIAAHTEPKFKEALHPVPSNSHWLLETVQAIGTTQFASRASRMSSAEAFVNYCKSALARVPYSGPRVGLTEKWPALTAHNSNSRAGGSPQYSPIARKPRITILDANDVQRETGAWISLTRLLEQEETVRKLGASAQLLQPARQGAENDNIFGTDNWRTMRVFIFEAVAKLLGNP